jgi:methyl-accepting chemotaxis protein
MSKEKKSLSIRFKLYSIYLIAGGLPIIFISLFSYFNASTSLEAESYNKLTAIREMKAAQIEDYFQLLRNQVETTSDNIMIIEAMREFKTAFNLYEAEAGITPEQSAEEDTQLKTFYETEFLTRLNKNLESSAGINPYWPPLQSVRSLQYRYIAGNPEDVGSKDQLTTTGDGTTYDRIHTRYHKNIRHFLQKFGYYDIFLVDDQTGHIVYSVFKEVDFGTSLLTGPYKDTNFAAVFRSAADAGNPDFVKLEDFKPYHPSYNAQASFIASPIFDNGVRIGVLIFQMPIERINTIMTNNGNWQNVGLGESGETYLVGDDFTLRNQSRFFIENKENYLSLGDKLGLSEAQLSLVDNINSLIGIQRVETLGVKEALAGKKGTTIIKDYRGENVLSSFRPLSIEDVKWVILSEIDESEAFRPVYVLRNIMLITMAVTAVLVFLVILFTIKEFMLKPLDQTVKLANQLADGDFTNDIQIKSNDEFGKVLHSMKAFQERVSDILKQLKNIIIDLTQLSMLLNQNTDDLSSSAQNQSSSIEEITAAVEELAAGMDSISGDTIVQGNELTMLRKQIMEMNSSIQTLDVEIHESLKQTHTISDDTVSGEKSLVEMKGSIDKIAGSSVSMRDIIKLITDISEQVNLLSLNASIESARAGEAGKGFAVVADEILKLAEETNSSIQEISQLISINDREISHGIENVSSITTIFRDIASEIKNITELAGKLTNHMKNQKGVFTNIEHQADTTLQMSEQISSATSQHKSAINEITITISGVNESIQTNAQRSVEIASLAEDLEKMAESLNKKIGFFKVE